jgi:hypothetical protein
MKRKWKRARRVAATVLFLAIPATSGAMVAAIAVNVARQAGELGEQPRATTRPATLTEVAAAAGGVAPR